MAASYGSSKANVMAIKKETTPGTLVAPASGTDFLALQPDFELTPNFETLENSEIRASIGMAKKIQGLEKPQGSFSHYLKHSGVEGTAPETSDVLESAFGSTVSNGTQRLTTVSSTVALLKLASGGSDFARGKAVLIKDPTNGYQIRPVHSVSTNDLTLGFKLAAAPATGLGVGKCVNFSPANSGHPSLSIHSYRGNGHLYEALVGALVGEVTMQAQAGQLINMNFAFQGTKYYFNPITIGATDIKLDFDDGSARVATIAAKIYRDPFELATALQDAMNAAGSSDTFTVTFLGDDAVHAGANAGKFVIASSGASFSLKWNTGANAANSIGDQIGYSLASDDTSALTYTSDTALSYAAPYTPSLDSSDPLAAKYLEVMLGDDVDYTCFCAQEVNWTLTNTVTDVLCICAESGVDQKKVTAREAKVTVRALLPKHEADKFRRYRANSDTRFAFNFGSRSGGNWVAGQCGNLYLPSATISKFNMIDLETLIGIELELTSYVDSSGNGEVYLNFL
jgi:hypothetical protein